MTTRGILMALTVAAAVGSAAALSAAETPRTFTEPLRKLAADYPGERVLHMLIGQNLAGLGRHDEARAAYEQAIRISDRTPRAYHLLGNYHLLKGDSGKAREYYTVARGKVPKGVAPGAIAYNVAFTTHLYEGEVDQALKTLTAYVDEFKNATVRFGEVPEVFIWNSIARINLENGRLEEAMIVNFPQSNLARALAYREAKKRLATL